jgi:hypothetical protein
MSITSLYDGENDLPPMLKIKFRRGTLFRVRHRHARCTESDQADQPPKEAKAQVKRH